MVPATVNMIIYQGSTFRRRFQWTIGEDNTPVDLTSYQGRMQIRLKKNEPIIIELTTENNGIEFIDTVNGVFQVYLTAIQTSNFDFKTAVYDIELYTSEDEVIRVIEGAITLSFEVTKIVNA